MFTCGLAVTSLIFKCNQMFLKEDSCPSLQERQWFLAGIGEESRVHTRYNNLASGSVYSHIHKATFSWEVSGENLSVVGMQIRAQG
jgi:hypothetical protein